jgi:hypothetical protein
MFSASYQRYSMGEENGEGGDAGKGGNGDGDEKQTEACQTESTM